MAVGGNPIEHCGEKFHNRDTQPNQGAAHRLRWAAFWWVQTPMEASDCSSTTTVRLKTPVNRADCMSRLSRLIAAVEQRPEKWAFSRTASDSKSVAWCTGSTPDEAAF